MSNGEMASEGLERARARRMGLRSAMEAFEDALASAASPAGSWLARVTAATADLESAIRAHIDEVEGPTGLLAEIRAGFPRLSYGVDDLSGEHPELLGSLARLGAALESGEPRLVRRRAVALLGRLTMHRQAGSDLVYEAYQVDIGGQG